MDKTRIERAKEHRNAKKERREVRKELGQTAQFASRKGLKVFRVPRRGAGVSVVRQKGRRK